MEGRDEVRTRRFAAEGASFTVRCPSETIKNAVESLLVDLAEPDHSDADREILIIESDDDQLSVRIDNGEEYGPRPASAALAGLVTAVTRLALDETPDQLHLHCAALTLDDRGVLISAAAGTGKSTLAAALIGAGWTYVSDEAVAFGLEVSMIHGFPKPLMIKPGGGDLVPELRAARISLAADDDGWWQVPASAITTRIASRLSPSLIVILHRQTGGVTTNAPVATPLHPVDTVVELMQETMDPERFGPDAIVALSRLAARCRCVSLPVGPLVATTALLRELNQQPLQPLPVRVLDRVERTEISEWQPAQHVRSVVVGERVVIHEMLSGSVIALDDAGSAVWRSLHHDSPLWWTNDMAHSASTMEFLQQLWSIGLMGDKEHERNAN